MENSELKKLVLKIVRVLTSMTELNLKTVILINIHTKKYL